MQLIINENIKFDVNTLSETLSYNEAKAPTLELIVDIAYYDSIEDLVHMLEEIAAGTITIVGTGDSKGTRTYQGYSFGNVNQFMEQFDDITTTLHFLKVYAEEE